MNAKHNTIKKKIINPTFIKNIYGNTNAGFGKLRFDLCCK